MKVKMPTRLAVAAGTLIIGAEAIAGELTMPHPVHQAIVLAGAVLLLLINPTQSGPLP